LILEKAETDLQRLMETNYIEMDDKFNYLFQIIEGMNHLHTLNIVHRDVKPLNVLVRFLILNS
jgi:serine/threonine protein kinase